MEVPRQMKFCSSVTTQQQGDDGGGGSINRMNIQNSDIKKIELMYRMSRMSRI